MKTITSNQFPKPIPCESIPINTRARIVLGGIKENLPDLYKYIKTKNYGHVTSDR